MLQEVYNPAVREQRESLGAMIGEGLERRGFSASVGSGEVIFSRTFGNFIEVKVYSSCIRSFGGLQLREKDKDAIRIVVLYTRQDGQIRNLVKQGRTYRTGEIGKILQRMADRVGFAMHVAENPELCKQCGAAKFESKAGNLVCAEACWANKPEAPAPEPAQEEVWGEMMDEVSESSEIDYPPTLPAVLRSLWDVASEEQKTALCSMLEAKSRWG